LRVLPPENPVNLGGAERRVFISQKDTKDCRGQWCGTGYVIGLELAMRGECLPESIHPTDCCRFWIYPVDVFGVLVIAEGAPTFWAKMAVQGHAEVTVAFGPPLEVYMKSGVNGWLS